MFHLQLRLALRRKKLSDREAAVVAHQFDGLDKFLPPGLVTHVSNLGVPSREETDGNQAQLPLANFLLGLD